MAAKKGNLLPAKGDWANLLPELVGRIARCLTLNDYLHFGAVCTSWRSVITQLSGNGRRVHRPNPVQLPWLMMAGEEGESSIDSLTFISLPDGKSFRISPIPELRGGWWVGSGDGWLVTLDAMGEMRLINPLTRRMIPLPPVTTFPGIEALRDESGTGVVEKYRMHHTEGGIVGNPYVEFPVAEFRSHHFRKVVSGLVSSKPPSLVAMALINPWQDLAFARAGSESWAVIPSSKFYHDIVYYNDRFFTVTATGDILVWELTGPSPTLRMAQNFGICTLPNYEKSYFKKYLVKCGERNLYQVWRELVFLQSGLSRTTTVVVMMNICSIKKEWVLVKSLGEQSFFLGMNQAVALSVPELRKNCIYFTDDCDSFFSEGHLTRDMGVYSLEDRTYQPYYPPEQQVKWPEPIWFMPEMF